MPRRAPFTRLCQTAARLASPKRADLHSHTTASDGDFTPSQLVVHARTAGLVALAVTDHDSTKGIAEARATAAALSSKSVEIIAGVEISTRHAGRDFHLLGYFIDGANSELLSKLFAIRERRRHRFESYLSAFRDAGAAIPDHFLQRLRHDDIALTRRHLAHLLVAAGHANTPHIAFAKYLNPLHIPSSHAVPFADALSWIHAAGGAASLAHPPDGMTRDDYAEMKSLGLDAVECNSGSMSHLFSLDLADLARSLGLAVTAGSDFHGGSHVLGSRTIDIEQLEDLRGRARSSVCGI